MKTPVLFLVFNRPDTTERVFEAIREAKPERLYVAADGAREGREGEAERCAETRRIGAKVDWPCEVKTLFRDENLGCRLAVSEGIDWFFEHEEEGIILEDDCLPDPSFFPYCEELLKKYRDDKRVMCITGDRSFPSHPEQKDSYLFSSFPLIWGWATWRRAWKHYDFERFQMVNHELIIRAISSDTTFISRRISLYQAVIHGEIDTWDCVWGFCIWAQGGLTCVPKVNLISNIGFTKDATHTHDTLSDRANFSRRSLVFPINHPEFVYSHPNLNSEILKFIHFIDPMRPLLSRILEIVRTIMRKVSR